MANHKSAKKSIRQIEKRTLENKSRMSDIKTFIKKLETAISAKDSGQVKELFSLVQSKIMKGAKKSLFKVETASRKIKRLHKKIKDMAA